MGRHVGVAMGRHVGVAMGRHVGAAMGRQTDLVLDASLPKHKNLLPLVQGSNMGPQYNIKFFSYAQLAFPSHWVERGDISFQNFPGNFGRPSFFKFSPKVG